MEGGVNLMERGVNLHGRWSELTWKEESTYMEGGVNLHGRRSELTWKVE